MDFCIEFEKTELTTTIEKKFFVLPEEEFYFRWYLWFCRVKQPIEAVNKGKTWCYLLTVVDDTNSIRTVNFYLDTVKECFSLNDASPKSIFAQLLVKGGFERIEKQTYVDRLQEAINYHLKFK